jgi:hypothetical protein
MHGSFDLGKLVLEHSIRAADVRPETLDLSLQVTDLVHGVVESFLPDQFGILCVCWRWGGKLT